VTCQIANRSAEGRGGRSRKSTGQIAGRPWFAEKLQELDREWRDHEPAIRDRLVENQLVVAPVQNGMPDSDVTVALTLQGSPRGYFAGVAVSSFGSDKIAMRPCAVNSSLLVGSGRTFTIAVNALTSFGSELLQL
jgi:hypothetical protein